MRRLKILIIDDDQEDIDLFRDAVLEIDSGIRIDSATTAEEALSLLNTSPHWPNFIFLDLNMPRMSGKECIAIIKKDPRFRTIPIVIYTTSKLSEDAEQTKTLGADYFMTKPSRLIDLKNAVSAIIYKGNEVKKTSSIR